MLTYTKKAECDGVGKSGEAVEHGADLAYLTAHGYCVEVPEVVEVETGAVAAPSRFMRSKKVKP